MSAHAVPGPGDVPSQAGEHPGEEAAPRRALALPDLRPYAVPGREAVVELGHLAADVTYTTAPRIGRGLLPLLRALVLVLRAWFSGELAPKVGGVWRLVLVPLLVVYLVGQTVARYPWTPLLLIPAVPLAAVLARRWATRQADRKGGKGTAQEVSKELGKGARTTLPGRLAEALRRAPAAGPPEAPAEASAGPTPDAPAEVEETPSAHPPAAPSRDDLVRALHALVEDSSGVLHTALRDRLRYPSTRAVREALEAAHIPSRSGVRAVGGNGPGVHRRDIPPLPPPREGSPGRSLSQVNAANNNANNGGEGSGEGLAVDGSEGERKYPFDVVPDPERGPSAWRIIPHE